MSYDERTFNPKKHKDQRRKRPVYAEGQIPRAMTVEIKRKSASGVERTVTKVFHPVGPQGRNRRERLADRSKFRHGKI